jgi:hypothetical protein
MKMKLNAKLISLTLIVLIGSALSAIAIQAHHHVKSKNVGRTNEKAAISPASSQSNLADDPQFFVQTQYRDFLNREPDTSGLVFWTNQITSCGNDLECSEIKRINVSAAFFLSIEFQETGYLVYRTYKTAFGNLSTPEGAPVPVKFSDFLQDTQQIGQNVQVNVGDWQAQLENNKQAYMLAFVERDDFRAQYPNTMTATDFVTQLNKRAGDVLSPAEQTTQILSLGTTPSDLNKRAQVLRAVAEDNDLKTAEFNRAFVLMQYFGYLRRDPNSFPDANYDGYNFWLTKLNSFNGNYNAAEMVKSFLVSGEYRQRFDTSDWQTFTSAAGFQLKYPVGWTSNVINTTQTAFSPTGKSPSQDFEYIGDITIDTLNNPSGEDLDTFYNNTAEVNLFEDSQYQEHLTINGLPAIVFSGVSGMLTSNVMAIKKGLNIIEITDVGRSHQNDGLIDMIANTVR